MFNSRRGALFAAVCSAGLALGLASAASAETLAEAIALAYDSNPTLQAQRATQRALDENWVQARAGYRPQLSARAGFAYEEDRRPGGAVIADTNGDGSINFLDSPVANISEGNQYSATLSLSQPIWTGGRVAAVVSQAEADVLTGRENLRRTEASVMQSVIQGYADTRRDQEALRIRQANVTVLQRQLDESKARFDVGEITRTDVAQSESRLAGAEAQLTSAQAQLAISRAAYAAVVGQNPGELAPEPSLATLLPPEVAQAYEAAEQNNAQIRAAQYTEQSSRARLAAARAERMPTVSLSSSIGTTGPADPYDQDRYGRSITAGATVSVPLFTGGITSSRVRAAIERNNTDRIGVEIARRSVMQGLTGAWNQLIASRSNITSTDQQVRAALIAAEGTRQEQQVGLRTTLDVLNAEQELRAAELAQVSARRDEYVAASLVLGQMGRLEAPMLIQGVTAYDPKANFNKLRITWGWVPWEEPLAIADGVLTPKVTEKPASPPQAPPLTVSPAAPK